MISYTIKTWRCTCGYAQDFEPTADLMNLHFNQDKGYSLNDVRLNECPSCALKGSRSKLLIREINPVKKTIHTFLEQSDIDRLVSEAENDSALGTVEEKSNRIESIRLMKLKTKDEIASLRALHEDI